MEEGTFNKNANADLLLWGEPSHLLLGNGHGNFAVSAASACSFNFPVAVGEFNGDGSLDVAGPATFGNPDRINVCLNNGNGVFTAGGEFDQGVEHRMALAGNFTGGTTLDLAASDENGFSVLLNNGDGSFANGIPTSVARTWPTFVVGDFNGDGKADVAALTNTGVAVYIGNGDGTFKSPIETALPTTGSFIGTADLNNDQKNDLVVATNANLTVLLGNGDGTFQKPVSYAMHAGAITRPVFGDFSLNGNVDVAIAVTTSQAQFNAVEVFTGSSTGKLTGPTVYRAGGPITSLATGDFNGDKRPDLAFIGGVGVVTLLHQ